MVESSCKELDANEWMKKKKKKEDNEYSKIKRGMAMEDRWKGEKVDRESSSAFVVVVASLDERLGSIHGRSDGHSRQERLDRLQDLIRESYAQSSMEISVCGVPAGDRDVRSTRQLGLVRSCR